MNDSGARPEKFTGADERIFGLLAIAEDQQTAVRASLEGLALERAALAKERVGLAEQAEQMKQFSDKLAAAVREAIPLMAQTAALASRNAFNELLKEAGHIAAGAAKNAAKPELDKFTDAVKEARAVQLAMQKAVQTFQKRWTWVAALATAATILASGGVALGVVWWQRQELKVLEIQRDKLISEINGLQNQADQVKRGGTRRGAKP